MGDAQSQVAAVRSNNIKSVLLLAGFPFVIPIVVATGVLIGALLLKHPTPGQLTGTTFAVGLAATVAATVIWLPIGYVLSQWIIDRATGARLVARTEEQRLWRIYEKLCATAELRMPALRLIEVAELNAFASGLAEGRYSVTVTRGLVNALDDDELEAVLAHELAHIRNQDVRFLVIATILVGMVPLLHDLVMRVFWALVMGFLKFYQAVFGLLKVPLAQVLFGLGYTAIYWAGWLVARVIGIVSNICSLIIHYALSRTREFMADAGAVEITGKPDAMISALRKVSCNSALNVGIDGVREMLFDSPAMFGLGGLFSTHPPVDKRIEALVALKAKMPSEAPPREIRPATAQLPPAPTVTAPQMPSQAQRYREVILRAMNGNPRGLSAEQRREVYQRALRAIDARAAQEPGAVEPAVIRDAKRTLQMVIAQIEQEIVPRVSP